MSNPLLNMIGNMKNNPLMNIVKMIQSGGNPQQLINQIVNQNPNLKNIMNNINGKDTNQLKDMFYSMCNEKGINPQDIAKQYNINLPK